MPPREGGLSDCAVIVRLDESEEQRYSMRHRRQEDLSHRAAVKMIYDGKSNFDDLMVRERVKTRFGSLPPLVCVVFLPRNCLIDFLFLTSDLSLKHPQRVCIYLYTLILTHVHRTCYYQPALFLGHISSTLMTSLTTMR